MSCSTAPSEHSSNESDYVTSRFRRHHSTSEEYDPLEDSDRVTDQTSVRSPTPVPAPSPLPTRRLRVQATARKSVPLPVRETFTLPPRDKAVPL